MPDLDAALDLADQHLDAINGDTVTDPNLYQLIAAVQCLREAIASLATQPTTAPAQDWSECRTAWNEDAR